jgi:hypothetical protein
LEKAGVKYALCSDGMSNAADFISGLRTIAEEGLEKEAVLQAATLNPAQILGISKQLGTVEEGKIANLVVTDGDLFEKESQVKFVLVDGIKFEVPEKPKKPKGDPNAMVNISGRWDVEVTTPMGTNSLVFNLKHEGESLSGTVDSDRIGSTSFTDGSVTGNEFSFKIEADMGMGPMTISFSGTVSEDSLTGTVTVAEMGSTPMEGTRVPEIH